MQAFGGDLFSLTLHSSIQEGLETATCLSPPFEVADVMNQLMAME